MLQILMGNYTFSVDEKGRVVIPSKFRDIIGPKIYVTLGFDRCISVYSETEFNKLADLVSSKSDFDPKAREFKRVFFRHSTEVEIDKQGRIALPKALMQLVNVTKEVYVNGSFNHIEIWDKDTFAKKELEQLEHYEENAASYCNPFGE